MIDGTNGTMNVIDLYDIKEIVWRLSGEKFSDDDLRKIAEAVGVVDGSSVDFVVFHFR